MAGSPVDIKVWPLDADGEPIMSRPCYHSFLTDDGMWLILRFPDGTWSAKFTSVD